MSVECGLIAVEPTLAEQVENDYAAGRGLLALRGARNCDLHKAWHAIHFLLTGSPDEAPLPEGYLLDGGREWGEPDPDEMADQPRMLSPEEVRAFAAVLRPLDAEELRRRFDHAAMQAADIYSIGSQEQDDFEFVEHYLAELREFIIETADAGQGAVITIG